MSRTESQKESTRKKVFFEEEEPLPEYCFEGNTDGRKIGTVYEMPDGSYEWLYELDMRKNNSILRVVLITLGACFIPILLLLVFLSFRDGFDLKMTLVVFACFLAAILIGFLCYWMVGMRYRWSYFMVYRMEEDGISFRQVKSQREASNRIGMALTAAGIASGSLAAASAGMRMGDHSARSEYKKVRRIAANRYTNQIDVISPFLVNMVYVTDEYYDFVLDYLARHCPDAEVKEI